MRLSLIDNPPYSGARVLVGCPLMARWQGLSRPRPATWRECLRGVPRLAPLRRRSSTGRVGSSPRPPRPPPDKYYLYSGVWCPSFVWCRSYQFYSRRFGGGARVPSVPFRPPRFGADVGRSPMSPAPRPRPPSACALGRCAPRLPVLGSLRSLRFKRACGGCSVPCRLAIARCGLSLAVNDVIFCNINMTKH